MAFFETVRVFVALNLEVVATRRVFEQVEHLQRLPGAPRLRWVSPSKLHVILKFFGEVDVGLAPAIRDAVAAIASVTPAPRVAFNGFSAFPSASTARVIFAPLEDLASETKMLARRVDDVAEGLGLSRDPREDEAHLTVARSTTPVSAAAWLSSLPVWRVVALASEVVLYRTDFARPGAEYDALGRFALAPRKSSKKTA